MPNVEWYVQQKKKKRKRKRKKNYFKTWQAYLVFLFIEHTHPIYAFLFLTDTSIKLVWQNANTRASNVFSNLIVYTNLTPWFLSFIFYFASSFFTLFSCFIMFYSLFYLFSTFLWSIHSRFSIFCAISTFKPRTCSYHPPRVKKARKTVLHSVMMYL